MSLMENLFGQQDNTRVVRNQPNQLFWNNWKIDRIVTPINNNQSLADNRDWITRQLNNLFESRTGRLYSDMADTPVNFVLPTREGVTNLVSNQSSGFDRAIGALETLPVVTGAGYKGFKALNKVVSSKFLDQANSILKSLPNRQTMDYNNNVEALTALQKFSDEKGYGLKNVIHYAKDQNKTDAAIKEIMNRNRTFVRGVSAPDKETAIKYLTEITPRTGHGTDKILPNEFANYSSNSLHNAIGYAGPDGYYGKIRLPVNYSGSNRAKWVSNNKTLPSNVVSDPYPSVIRNNDLISEVSNMADRQYGSGNLISNDLYEMSGQPEYLNDIYGNLFGMIKDKYQPLTKFKHYITKGNVGDKPFNLIDIKKVDKSNWKYDTSPKAQWKHQGEYSSGLSLAGLFGLYTANQDSIRNLFGGNR
jgi:hypothetical protein